jgi:hypothetical protein
VKPGRYGFADSEHCLRVEASTGLYMRTDAARHRMAFAIEQMFQNGTKLLRRTVVWRRPEIGWVASAEGLREPLRGVAGGGRKGATWGQRIGIWLIRFNKCALALAHSTVDHLK